ncbi:hypothetical protein [Streptomyces sp. NPDC056672]|uniref:hypothetical protein n=1 Tax=Streptomyces sp. NPDC056672 TaxID=3345906 RepID=UPI0036CD1EA9
MTETETEVVPAATLRAWQERANQQLGAFLARAARLDLPPLLWTLATNGNLVGTADSLSYTPDQQREAIRRWARCLQVEVDTDHVDGREELHAAWKHPKNGTHGCFRATIFVHRAGA